MQVINHLCRLVRHHECRGAFESGGASDMASESRAHHNADPVCFRKISSETTDENGMSASGVPSAVVAAGRGAVEKKVRRTTIVEPRRKRDVTSPAELCLEVHVV